MVSDVNKSLSVREKEYFQISVTVSMSNGPAEENIALFHSSPLHFTETIGPDTHHHGKVSQYLTYHHLREAKQFNTSGC